MHVPLERIHEANLGAAVTVPGPPPVSPLDHYEARAIQRMARRLRRSDPLREAATGVLAGDPVPAHVVEPARHAARGGSGRLRRAVGIWLLGLAQLSPEEREDALRCARRAHTGDTKVAGKRVMLASGLVGALVYAAIVGTLLWSMLNSSYWDVQVPMFAIWVGLFALVPAGMAATGAWMLLGSANATLLAPARRGMRSIAVRTLGRLRDLESLPELAMNVCDPGSRDPQTASAAALLRILPTVGAMDFGALPPRTVPELGRILTTANGPGRCSDVLALAVLDVLERIGDGRAVPVVEHVVRTRAGDVVWERAAAVLPVLQERLRAARSAQVLLRPSTEPGDAAAVLLRPADAGLTAPDADVLVRPASLDEDEVLPDSAPPGAPATAD